MFLGIFDIFVLGFCSFFFEFYLEEIYEGFFDDDFVGDDFYEEDISVVVGGYREGWGFVVVVVLWCRMLGILGNVNKIKDFVIYVKVFECFIVIWNMLVKVN